MKYRLSNSQRKELVVRARSLSIAIPAPIGTEPPDLVAWAKSHFDAQDSPYIQSVELEEIYTSPSGVESNPLQVRSGAIVSESAARSDCEHGKIILTIVVAVIRFEPPNRPRGNAPKLQWPAVIT